MMEELGEEKGKQSDERMILQSTSSNAYSY